VRYDFSQYPDYIAIANEIIGEDTEFGEDASTIAIFSDDNEFLAVVVYNNYTGTDIAMHIASVSPKWATRESLRVVFTYPFIELGVRRVTAATKAGLTNAIRMVQRLGFIYEGAFRDYYEDGDSDVLHGMRRDECRWI